MLFNSVIGIKDAKVISLSMAFFNFLTNSLVEIAEKPKVMTLELNTITINDFYQIHPILLVPNRIKPVCLEFSEEESTVKIPIRGEKDIHLTFGEAEIIPEKTILENEEFEISSEVLSEPLTGRALYESYVDEICSMYDNVPASIVKAIIEKESNFDPNCCSDGGDSCGLMQIQPQWHSDMMASLGVTDIFDPYGNILVGVNLLSGLFKEYPATEWALMCYNAGPYYGTLNYRNGKISNYAASIIARAKEIEGGG